MIKERFWNLVLLCGMFPLIFVTGGIGFEHVNILILISILLALLWVLTFLLVILGEPVFYVKQEYTEICLVIAYLELLFL